MTDEAILPGEMNKAEEARIRQAVEELQIEKRLAERKVVFDVNRLVDAPVRGCSAENAAKWKAVLSMKSVSSRYRLKAILVKNSWAQIAIGATHRTIKAFNLVKIPLILLWGPLIGWYRQCDIIFSDADLDFNVPMDYIVSKEHLNLLHVCGLYFFSASL